MVICSKLPRARFFDPPNVELLNNRLLPQRVKDKVINLNFHEVAWVWPVTLSHNLVRVQRHQFVHSRRLSIQIQTAYHQMQIGTFSFSNVSFFKRDNQKVGYFVACTDTKSKVQSVGVLPGFWVYPNDLLVLGKSVHYRWSKKYIYIHVCMYFYLYNYSICMYKYIYGYKRTIYVIFLWS